MDAPLFDTRGCLTDAGLSALANAPAGSGPPDLAAHVAACGRCQERLLAAGEGRRAARLRKAPPPPWRIWAVLGAAVLLLLSILVSIGGVR